MEDPSASETWGARPGLMGVGGCADMMPWVLGDTMAKGVASTGPAILTFAADQALQHPPLLLQGLGDRPGLHPAICTDRMGESQSRLIAPSPAVSE